MIFLTFLFIPHCRYKWFLWKCSSPQHKRERTASLLLTNILVRVQVKCMVDESLVNIVWTAFVNSHVLGFGGTQKLSDWTTVSGQGNQLLQNNKIWNLRLEPKYEKILILSDPDTVWNLMELGQNENKWVEHFWIYQSDEWILISRFWKVNGRLGG